MNIYLDISLFNLLLKIYNYFFYKAFLVLYNKLEKFLKKIVIIKLLKYRSETDHMSWRYLKLLLNNLDVEYNY